MNGTTDMPIDMALHDARQSLDDSDETHWDADDMRQRIAELMTRN